MLRAGVQQARNIRNPLQPCNRLPCPRSSMASARAPRGGPAPLRAHVPSPSRETPHPYQEELVQKASRVNALVSLGTGTGKTLIAAEVLRRRLAGLKAQGQVRGRVDMQSH